MSVVIENRPIRRPEPVIAPAITRPVHFAGLLRHAGLAALPLYAILVLSYPPALTGQISIPTSPGSILDVFDLAMAALMPPWLVFPVRTGIGDDAARAAAALAFVASMAALCRR